MNGLRKLALGTAALALTAGSAAAGGIEWMSPSTGIGLLFEKGRHVEFSLGSVSPHITGHSVVGGAPSGNMVKPYMPFSLGIKLPLGQNLDFAFMVNTPSGAKVDYPAGSFYPLSGSTANITQREYKALLRYKLPSNISVYGGVRMDEAKGEANVINPYFDYVLTTQKNASSGWLGGIAYEKPDIALRVSLTYNSPITHDFSGTESVTGPALAMLPAALQALYAAGVPTQFKTTMPKSWTLDFQTGVAPKTLLFGSVEWRQWKAFQIAPAMYQGLTGGTLVDYSNNSVTWNLGLGRQFTDTLSGAISFGYEKANGGLVGNLGPTDGYKSVTVAMVYAKDKMKVTTGVTYAKIGDATTNGYIGNFSGNHALGVGVKVGYSF